MTLVIMAAGMGSRFGGLKQIESIGPNGEYIIDYSIYDAIKAGFNKVVFIIKEENYDLFRETLGKRIENKIEVDYVFQDIKNVPIEISVNNREKPWGTSHAIWSVKDKVKENFVVINADDFYGREAFYTIKEFLNNPAENTYAIVGYLIKNTMTKYGSVKRGVCQLENGYLTGLIESSITEENGEYKAVSLEGNNEVEVDENTLVSMNFFGFQPSMLEFLDKEIAQFFKQHQHDLETCEYLIPTSVSNAIKENNTKVEVLKCDARWLGMTYREDKDELVEEINKMINDGIYPKNLW